MKDKDSQDNSHNGVSEESRFSASKRGYRGKYPLSYAQRRLWFISQLEPGNPSYNISHAIRLLGGLDVEAFRRSIGDITIRHDILRTIFDVEQGEPYQYVTDREIGVLYDDFSSLTRAEKESRIRTIVSDDTRYRFDLRTGPLLRVRLARLDENEHVFTLTMHHIIADEQSLGIFCRELGVLYESYTNKIESPLSSLPMQYADYSLWQRDKFGSDVLERQRRYWKEQLVPPLPNLLLWPDHTRPPEPTYNGASHHITLDETQVERLRSLSLRSRTTPFITLLAAFKVFLHRYSGLHDIIVGAPFASRRHRDAGEIIGFFLNTLALRTDLSGNPTFEEMLLRVRKTVMDAHRNQDYPFDRIVEMVNPSRDRNVPPLFQVMFVMGNTADQQLELAGLKLQSVKGDAGASMYDLVVFIADVRSTIDVSFIYNTDLFDDCTISRMIEHFGNLIDDVIEHPRARLNELKMMNEADKQWLLFELNDTRKEFPEESCIHELFEEQAAETPDAIAVEFESSQITYGELSCRAGGLADHLRKRGVGPEQYVGICMERSIEMVIGILGILKSGGAYVPLDPQYPKERIDFILEDTGVSVLLTRRGIPCELPVGSVQMIYVDDLTTDAGIESVHDTGAAAHARNLAYVMYTSGSTGRPKGVLVEHRGLCNAVLVQIPYFQIHRNSHVLQFASISFDASVSEIFTTLVAGGRLCLASWKALLPGEPLVKTLRELDITVVTLTPSVLEILPEDQFPALQVIVSASEACSVPLARKWARERCFINGYGLTETTICVALNRYTEGDSMIPIGKPVANMHAYVLTDSLLPVPVGAPGELDVSGAGLVRGYHRRPGLTAEKFIPNPYAMVPEQRLYRTGDLCRCLADGRIDFLGRVDRQIKIRGFRIEPGEIENVLIEHPRVTEAIVVAADGPTGEKTLVAYIAAEGDPMPSLTELTDFVKRRLPRYMIPSTFVVLESLPLLPSGKHDLNALSARSASVPVVPRSRAGPRDPIEQTLAGIWKEVLGHDRIGIDEDFFELGGHSLLALKVVSRIRETLDAEIPLHCIFEEPTIARLASVINGYRDGRRMESHISRKESDRERAELLLSQVDRLPDDEVDSLLRKFLDDEESGG